MDNREKLEKLKSKINDPKLTAVIDKKLGYVNEPVEKKLGYVNKPVEKQKRSKRKRK